MIQEQDIEQFSARNPVVTVGIFDGVHLGHRYILRKLVEAASQLDGEPTLLTFWPHPRTILDQAGDDFRLLNTMEEKIAMLEEAGIRHMVVIPFTRSFSRLTSCEFILEYLVRRIRIRHLVVGYNHRFGRDREGDYEKLRECAGQYGFGIERVPPLDAGTGEVSSSRIRTCLKAGDVATANRLLGWEYAFSGEVAGGSRLGTSIGFPTANITPGESYKMIPADGVYAVRASLREKTYTGMLNIGSRPTVNDDPGKKTIEVHLLDFDGNIYSEKIRVSFVERLRDEQKFRNIEALREQLVRDREKTRELFLGGGAGNSP
jgi:riboflavin kinase/FMN adenylyltransferase